MVSRDKQKIIYTTEQINWPSEAPSQKLRENEKPQIIQNPKDGVRVE